MIRVVADTNILISALMFGGLPGYFLDLAFLQSFALVTSSPLLDELDEKLRGKFGVSPQGCG
jgi:predicted nucleic acid-binding protein